MAALKSRPEHATCAEMNRPEHAACAGTNSLGGATRAGTNSLRFAPFASLGSEIKNLQEGKSLFVITDENVARLYLSEMLEALENQGFEVSHEVIPPGETSKNNSTYINLLNKMAEAEITRADGVIAFGGGVVGDLAGFAAGTFLRGINVYQVPTTLLAMVDSAIGGKTGINLDAGKNLAGVFNMPRLVLEDVSLLGSLPDEEIRNGMAEVIKYGILAGDPIWSMVKEPGVSTWGMLKEPHASTSGAVREPGGAAEENRSLNELIKSCAEYKMEIVSRDERDLGERQLLNLGHTIGHALEKLSGYEVKHGYAVAKGLSAAAKLAEKLAAKGSFASRASAARLAEKLAAPREGLAEEIDEVLARHGFDLSIEHSGEEIFDQIKNDKKRKSDYIDIVLPMDIGKCEIVRLSMDELKEAIL